jgi:hypothetical protein
MELMQKYVKEDGAVGIDDLHRWNHSSDAVGFLSTTTSAVSAAEMLEVRELVSGSLNDLSLTIAASAPNPAMAERFAYRFGVFGPGLFTWTL